MVAACGWKDRPSGTRDTNGCSAATASTALRCNAPNRAWARARRTFDGGLRQRAVDLLASDVELPVVPGAGAAAAGGAAATANGGRQRLGPSGRDPAAVGA